MTMATSGSTLRVRTLDDPLSIDPTLIADTSERLVVAAAQVFAERGYDGAGPGDPARGVRGRAPRS